VIPILRYLLFGIVALLAIVAVFWAWVDWSGARQWHKAQAMFVKEGQPLDLRAVAPDPIPDAENFCAIPLLKDLTLVIDGDNTKGEPGKNRARLNTASLPPGGKTDPLPGLPNAAVGQRADLKKWAAWFEKQGSRATSGDATRDVLAALSRHDAVFQELAAGLDRPGAQWTPAWKTRELPKSLFTVPLPHLTCAQQLSRTLALRCIAAAHLGDAHEAYESAYLIARISDACLEEPYSIGVLVAASGTTLLTNAAWVLCDTQVGGVKDFSRLEIALSRMDFRRSTLRGFSGDIVFALNDAQLGKKTPELRIAALQMDGKRGLAARFAIAHLPWGFFDASSAVLADRCFACLIKPLRDQGWPAELASSRAFLTELTQVRENISAHPTYMLTGVFAPVLTKIVGKAIYAQTLVNQAVIACALERYRIANGSYPDSLALIKLVDGQPLPMDILAGKPMGYRQTANGKYALWCVSFDEKDHGGKRALDKEHPEDTKFWKEGYAGDWVWDFPEK
jgi:hypothetical protein